MVRPPGRAVERSGRAPCLVTGQDKRLLSKASSAELLFTSEQALRGGHGYISDHVGLDVRLHIWDA